jgi:glycosyltransferase involved in cell wall biosynthesis
MMRSLRGANIVCFAKEWSEDPTSNNHVMRLLAEENEILWLNSIATRTPDFTNRNDIGKIARKLKNIAHTPREVSPRLHVYSPIVLPFPHSPLATAINRQILRGTLGLSRRHLGMNRFQAWTFLPTAAEYIGTLGEELSVYYCTDEWSQFSHVDSEKVAAQERLLLSKVDLVFATSQGLLERKRAFNAETHLASHGVDHAHFARALDTDTAIAPELVHLRGPVIGFFGLLEDWIDLDLFAYLAKHRPEWTVVVIGKSMVSHDRLKRYPNILILDRRPYESLPSYCKRFDIGLCPFKIDNLTRYVNPIKLREYVSAGLPVVSTDLPECRLLPNWTRVGRSHEEILALIDQALREDSPDARRARSDSMKTETWRVKVTNIGEHVTRILANKQARASI